MASVKPGKRSRRTSELVQEAKPARKRSNDGQEDFNQIPALIRQTAGSSPQKPPLEVLKRASAKCRACDLWKQATQTVFGDGNASASMMLVGEQPGDREDIEGKPFVGPAGKLLREAMLAAEIDPHDAYLTNVVKHFRWMTAGRGKRRIHKKPRQSEINACHPWLEAELEAVTPKVLVCLGATAAKALLGSHFSVSQERGKVVPSSLACAVVTTVHPSSILRSPDSDSRRREMQSFVRDLRKVAQLIRSERAKPSVAATT